MSLAQLIPLAVNLSMFLIVLALGLETTMTDALSLRRRPALLLRSMLAMYLVMLALALALATGARHPGVAIAIASVNFPDGRSLLAVVLYHLIFAAIVSVPTSCGVPAAMRRTPKCGFEA
jgi:predicted Na+-dependent transporter